MPPPLRMVPLVAAGTRKTQVRMCVVRKVREIFAPCDSEFVSAHTGVAASNVGFGARALASLFKTMGESGHMPVDGETMRSLHRLFPRCALLITDEISMVGAQKFAAASIRSWESKINLDIFGGMGAALCGDFAQIRPIGRETLMAPMSAGGSRLETSR